MSVPCIVPVYWAGTHRHYREPPILADNADNELIIAACLTPFSIFFQVTGSEFEVGPEFRLQTLLEIGMVDKKEVRTPASLDAAKI